MRLPSLVPPACYSIWTRLRHSWPGKFIWLLICRVLFVSSAAVEDKKVVWSAISRWQAYVKKKREEARRTPWWRFLTYGKDLIGLFNRGRPIKSASARHLPLQITFERIVSYFRYYNYVRDGMNFNFWRHMQVMIKFFTKESRPISTRLVCTNVVVLICYRG